METYLPTDITQIHRAPFPEFYPQSFNGVFEKEIFNVYCPACGYTDFLPDYNDSYKSIFGLHFCLKCNDAAMYIIPYPLLKTVKELMRKNYLICSCCFTEENIAKKEMPYIEICFMGQIYFPFMPADFALAYGPHMCGDDATIIFYHGRDRNDPTILFRNAVILLDWAIALPKREEKTKITYDALEADNKYLGMPLEVAKRRLEIKE